MRPGSATEPARAHRRGPRWLPATLLLCGACVGHAEDVRYVVQPGDNPWNVTERYLLGVDYWPRIQTLNRITDPTHLRPGTVLRLPAAWLKRIATEVRLTAWSGDVSWSRPDGVAVTASAGAVLMSGARLRTGANASATLVFDDGSRVVVLSDSELWITQAARYAAGGPAVQLQLIRGALENLVTPRGDLPGRFEISTPAAVAAVRGTEFRVSAGANEARSEVLRGAVDLGNAAGRQGLRPGFGSRTDADRAPIAPVPLLPAPDLAAAPGLVERLPFAAAIPPLPGAVAYRTQLATDAAFGSVVANRLVDGPALTIVDVADGEYRLRARGVDANGLEGFSADRTITVHARPEPPTPIEPPVDAQVVAERPTLRWTGVARATTYHLQLSDAATFTTVLLDEPMLATTSLQTPAALGTGPYFWRVATSEAPIGQGPYSDAQPFRRVLPGPGIDPPDPGGDPLDLRWRSAGSGVHYRVQLARDVSFGTPLIDTVVTDPRYPLKKPEAGDYFLRVAAIAPDGYAGPWGTVQTLSIADASTPWWPVLLFLVPLLFL